MPALVSRSRTPQDPVGVVELAVADRVNGREVRNTSALANPEALDAIARLPELRR